MSDTLIQEVGRGMMSSVETPSTIEQEAERIEASVSSDTAFVFALDGYTSAAELYMRACKLVKGQDERRRLAERCRIAVQKAEDVKKLLPKRPLRPLSTKQPSPLGAVSPGPTQNRNISTHEQIILLKGSKLNGYMFTPWVGPPDPSEFEQKDGEGLFIDEPVLKLSEDQLKHFDGWKRLSELSYAKAASQKNETVQPSSTPTGVVDLVQDVATDCSVVASLCAGTARTERGHARIINGVVWPYDANVGGPAKSPNGKYMFRFYFNGCDRRIVIDDRLPSSSTDRALHVVNRNDPSVLWPALVEKAYLKIRGGYDFPGSNSGTDIWILSGWIPQQLILQSDDLIPDQLWQKLYRAFHTGDVLITIGTGRLTSREEEGLGLAGQHDYAILDLYQSHNQRLFLIKNPWTNGTVWKGSIPASTPHENDEGIAGDQWTNAIKEALPEDRKLSSGSFWMDFNSVLQSFETLYVNWNPALFGHREDLHFGWDLSAHSESPGCFGENPQCAITCEKGGEVWLLLSRHFQSGDSWDETTDETTVETTVSTEDAADNSHPGYISLYVFDSNGQRVFLSDGALHRGPYVDSPQTLVQIEVPPKRKYTVVVSQQFLQPISHTFTLTAYSKQPVNLMRAAEKYPFFSLHHSAWLISNAGGNAGYASYPKNPQFGIRVPARTDIALLVETEVAHLSVHVKLVWADGKRATHVTNRDIVGGSGEYRQQSALAEISQVEAGQYTIICSTFEPWQLGKFTLRVSATISCIVWPIPAEDAGKLSLILPKASFPAGIHRQAAPLIVQRLTKLKVIGRYPDPSIAPKSAFRSPLRLAIESGRQHITAIFAESNGGTFSDAITGVRTPEVDLDPQAAGKHGHLWIVLERQVAVNDDNGKAEDVDVEVLSDHKVEVGPWQAIST